MKRRSSAGIVVFLLVCLVLGDISLRAMLVCVHESGDRDPITVHFHYGQLPGQPCDKSPTGLCHTTGENGRRHFSLAMEALKGAQASFKRDLPLSTIHVPIFESADGSPAGAQCLDRFQSPSFLFLDTAFTKTTILIV